MKLKLNFLLALLAVFALVVAACGNDNDDGAAPVPAPTEAPLTPTPEQPGTDRGPHRSALYRRWGLSSSSMLYQCRPRYCGTPPSGIRVESAGHGFSDVVVFVDIPGLSWCVHRREGQLRGGLNGFP